MGPVKASSGRTGGKAVGPLKAASGKKAGKRSGVRRSATIALVLKKKWLDLILAGKKTWEIRGSATTQRGYIHFAESKVTGQIKGRARLVDSFPLTKPMFEKHRDRHRLTQWSEVGYKKPHAWVVEAAERFGKPFVFEHAQGAVIWVCTRG